MTNLATHLNKIIRDANSEELAQRFAERVTLAKMAKEDAIEQTAQEWETVHKWVASTSDKKGSFVWCCEMFDLDVGAVRKAIYGRVK